MKKFLRIDNNSKEGGGNKRREGRGRTLRICGEKDDRTAPPPNHKASASGRRGTLPVRKIDSSESPIKTESSKRRLRDHVSRRKRKGGGRFLPNIYCQLGERKESRLVLRRRKKKARRIASLQEPEEKSLTDCDPTYDQIKRFYHYFGKKVRSLRIAPQEGSPLIR